MPDTATLDADVILPNWSTIIEATLVAPPYVDATTVVFASPTKTLPVDALAVNWPELANTAVDGGIVIVVFDAELRRPCASTVITGIAEEPPYTPAETPVVVRFPDWIVLDAILAPVIVASTILFALMDVSPSFTPVTAPSTILLALIAVRPSLSPVTAPAAILGVVTEPSDGTCVAEPLPMCRMTKLFVPLAGAETNDITSAIRLYVVGG